MNTAFGSLPDEILCEVFSYFSLASAVPAPGWSHPNDDDGTVIQYESRKVLSSLVRVSKRIAELVHPFLYARLAYERDWEGPDFSILCNPLDYASITPNRNMHFCQHVRELVLDIYDIPSDLATLLSSALINVTRATFKLCYKTASTLAVIVSGLRNLQALILHGEDPFMVNVRTIPTFFAHLRNEVCLTSGSRKGQLQVLEFRNVNLSRRGINDDMSTFLDNFEPVALSFYSCDLTKYDFTMLKNTTVTHLSIGSYGEEDQLKLDGLAELVNLDTLRIGNMYLGNLGAELRAIPPHIRVLQFYQPDHLTLKTMFESPVLDAFGKLRILDFQGLESLVDLQCTDLSDQFPSESRDYSAYLSSASTGLTAWSKQSIRVMPSDVLEILERCAIEAWGKKWREAPCAGEV